MLVPVVVEAVVKKEELVYPSTPSQHSSSTKSQTRVVVPPSKLLEDAKQDLLKHKAV